MRRIAILIVLMPLVVASAGCGSGDGRSGVAPQDQPTQIVPPSGSTRLCAPSTANCER